MSAEGDFRLAIVSLNTALSDRIYWQKAPDGCAAPYGVMQRLGTEYDHYLDSSDTLPAITIELSLFADRYDQCKDIAAKLRVARGHYSSDRLRSVRILNERDLHNHETEYSRIIQEYRVIYEERT